MGVQHLWEILEDVAEEQPLSHLEGKKVAVDLSIWILQSELQTGFGKNRKPHLKGLFYRVKHMLINRVHPIFVFDGIPPEVKENKIKERNIASYSKLRDQDYDGGSGTRKKFSIHLDECEELLKLLGVPCLKSNGEAEALCAYLNSKRVVDGCITGDSDAFLYGAETVFRDFKITPWNHKIKEYTLKNIEEKHRMNREKLIALALLLGSDYNKGITGVGKETVLRMFNEMGDTDVLQRFDDYKVKTELELFPNYDRTLDEKNISHCSRCGHMGTKTEHKQSGCQSCHRETGCLLKKTKVKKCLCYWHKNQDEKNRTKHELKVYEKVKDIPGFPDKKVIDEYLGHQGDIPSEESLKWQRPDVKHVLMRLLDWFGFTEEHCFELVLPIMTSWQMLQICQKNSTISEDFTYIPEKIKKEFVRHGEKYFEVLWKRQDEDATPRVLCTSENKIFFSEAYPDIASEYADSIEREKKNKKGCKRLPSPSKAKGSSPDLEKNAKMGDYFPVKKKRAIKISKAAPINEKFQPLDKVIDVEKNCEK